MAENGIQDDFTECPLCMEPLALDDINFYPCACRYQICRFCWHRIRTDENGLCPHCREPYSENPAEYTPPTQEQMAKLKSEKKQKNVEKRQKIIESRKNLASVRVVQKNLVFVIGLSPRLADPEILKRNEYFGKFGRIYKVVINNHTVYNGAQGPSVSAYVTYVKNEDASKAITAVNNAYIDGRYLKASFGTTKYCTSFLRGMQCSKPDCMYLHELGDDNASFTKEDMQLGKHQVYETATLAASNIPASSFKDPQQHIQQPPVGGAGGGVKIKHVAHKPATTDNAESALPATASWGSSVKSVSPATNHSSDSAQQAIVKEAKTNSNVAVSHSHSVGTSKHKHQQLSKSHSQSSSHGTGTSHLSSSHSKSTKHSSREVAGHHSRTKSGPLSPTHSNEPGSKKHSSREHEHSRSNSTGKSTPSLSPKSTLSGSSSSGSLKHEEESEVTATSESKDVSGDGASGEASLDTSKEGESESPSEEDVHVAEAVIDSNERGENTVEGTWCQIDESAANRRSCDQSQSVCDQEEIKESVEVAMVSENITATAVEEKVELEERKGGEEETATHEPEESPSQEEPEDSTQAPPTSSSAQPTEDSSIVKVIPSLGSGVSPFGSLGVSWNTALPQQLSSSLEPTPQAPSTEDVATPTSSTDHEDELGFDPWNVSQQGLADLMKSEQNQSHTYSFPNQPSLGQQAPPTSSSAMPPLSNGVGSGNKSSLFQEEFKALFPNVNVSFEGSSAGAVAGSSDSLLSSGLPMSAKTGPTSTTTSSYIPSRLDSALSSTYHPLLGNSPLPPMTSSSSSGGSLKMFLGQHQPGFPSSSIKVHSRMSASGSGASSIGSGTSSVGNKLGSSDWPDLGVTITSKPSSTQWSSSSTIDSTDSASKDTPTISSVGNASSSLPPPPPGFSAKTTSTTPGTAFSNTATSSSASARAPGSTLNNTVNHTLWTGGMANLKGLVASNPLLQSWANFIKFTNLTPAQHQQLACNSQIYQQLLIQQQYLIRQGLLLQSNSYYQAQAQVLAQAQATLRAQLQQNLLRQQQIAAVMAAAAQKIAGSATSTASNSTAGSQASSSTTLSSSLSMPAAVSHSSASLQQQQHQATTQHSAKEAGVMKNGGVIEGQPSSSSSSSLSVVHQRPHNPQMTSAAKHSASSSRTSSSKSTKNSVNTSAAHSATNTDRKTVRLKTK